MSKLAVVGKGLARRSRVKHKTKRRRKLGAMIWWSLDTEKLGLNLDTFWSGTKKDTNNYQAPMGNLYVDINPEVKNPSEGKTKQNICEGLMLNRQPHDRYCMGGSDYHFCDT